MSENQQVPLKISYTDEDVAAAAKRDRWAVGTYRGVLSDITKQVSKMKDDGGGGHLMFKLIYRALKDPSDASSIFGPAMYSWLCLPFRNPDIEGHTPKKFFARNTNEWLAAHLPEEVIALPVRDRDTKVLTFKGEALENSEEEAAKREAYDTSYGKAAELWEDESNEQAENLKGIAVFFDLYYQEGSDFPSLQNFRAELEDGTELVDPATALTSDMPAAVEEAEEAPAVKVAAKPNGKTNGKNGHAKPVTKPSAKPVSKGSKKK